MRSVENAECGKRGVWKMRSVENKSLNNDILNNDKFIDQTYTYPPPFEESTHWYHGQKPDLGKFEHVQHPISYDV